MTTIMYFPKTNVAVADCLVTHDGSGQSIALPTTPDSDALTKHLSPTGASYVRPIKLVRKVININFNGQSGTLLGAGIVKDLEGLAFKVDEVQNNIHDFTSVDPERIGAEKILSIALEAVSSRDRRFELIGVLDGAPYNIHYGAKNAPGQLPYFGEYRLGGNIPSKFHEWLAHRGESYSQLEERETDEYLRTYRTMLMIPSVLMEEDTRVTLDTLRNGIGGYYESYKMIGGRFVPLDHTRTVFADINEYESSGSVCITRLMFHFYKDEWLFVASLKGYLNLGLHKDDHYRLSDLEIFEIAPIGPPRPRPMLTPITLARAMASPENERVTLYRQYNDKSVRQRIASEIDRLLDIEVFEEDGGWLRFKLNQAGIARCLRACPPTPRIDLSPLISKRLDPEVKP